MSELKLRKSHLLIILLFFAFHLVWMFRAYKDVIWMDQVSWMAGNVDHLYNHSLSLLDFYYLTPYNQSFSMVWSMVNSKLFNYNTFITDIISAIILLLMAIYFIKAHLHFFLKQTQLYFVIFGSLIVFGLHKWETSLNAMGMGFYLAFFAVLVCLNMAHRYYLNQLTSPFLKKYFIPVYTSLGLFTILEYGPYFVPFQISLIGLLLLNYKIFRDKIIMKKWKTLLLLNISLIAIAFGINYFLNSYAANHSYSGYAKVTISQSLKTSLEAFIKDPIFVIKFFFIANTGNLLDNESYLHVSSLKNFIPFLGCLVVLLYGYCIYLFLKRRRLEYLYSINLILFVLIFYFLVTLSRLYFNDLYYGSASRYTAATFSGMLGVGTIFLLLFQDEKVASQGRKIFLASPIILICLCYLAANRNQWRIAPYRKSNFVYLIQNLKADRNLETMQGGGPGIVHLARGVMIKHQLSVFRGRYNLNNFTINSDLNDGTAEGFYDQENSSAGKWRWTNGQADIFLPNLYTDKDSIRVRLFCYSPNPDTPRIILNDNLAAVSCSKFNGGFEYRFRVYGPSVFYRARILNQSFVPHLLDSTNSDVRALGLVFNSIRFEELVSRR
jgi:hypothetical protein